MHRLSCSFIMFDPPLARRVSPQFDAVLPPGMRRSAPHIVKVMDDQGGARNWLLTLHRAKRRLGAQAIAEIWDVAWQFDMRLEWWGPHKSRGSFVASDTRMEIWARQLAAWGHVRTTGNRRVANQMLAVQPPGNYRDVAPKWLVAQAKRRKPNQMMAAQPADTRSRDVAPKWLVAQAQRRKP